MQEPTIQVGDVFLTPKIVDGCLHSLGGVRIGRTPLRNPATRFLPWFDTFAGDVFRRFEFLGVEKRGEETRLAARAWSDPDTLFREQRDSSGDLCLRNASWDAPALTAGLKFGFKPAQANLDGRSFTGFSYWFEFESERVAIHRLVDRQTWEVGGNLDDVTICLRNWLTPPRLRIARGTTYSTVGLEQWAHLLPGNLWARWTLLPSFDMQYGKAGALIGWFDEVSLIRSVVESNADEDWLRVLDIHLFPQSTRVRTNAKTILWSPVVLDHVEALNLWTRIQDREAEKARRQFGIRDEGPPAIVFARNHWRGFRFETSYEQDLDVAAEFGADYLFIDPVWEHQQAFQETLDALVPREKRAGTILEKFWHQNMCVTLDFEVARVHGGETGLKALCDRARAKGVRILSWMALHLSPNTALNQRPELGRGANGIFAARESGRHPDTGYPASCWAVNLHAPIAEKIKAQLLGASARTGLAGFLWDSVSNLGWWQVDYSSGTMCPQFDKMAALYADLVNDGLYVMPEGIVTFSNHSCCGLHAGDIYAGDLLGYSYNTQIAMWFGGNESAPRLEERIVCGEEPLDPLFQCVAHRRLPSLQINPTPRARWNRQRVAEIKELLAVYKTHRPGMQKRSVLPDGAGVMWEGGSHRLLFSFVRRRAREKWLDAVTGDRPLDGMLQPNRVYRAVATDDRIEKRNVL